MNNVERYQQVVEALRALGFEIDPEHFTIRVAGREVGVEEVVERSLVALLEPASR